MAGRAFPKRARSNLRRHAATTYKACGTVGSQPRQPTSSTGRLETEPSVLTFGLLVALDSQAGRRNASMERSQASSWFQLAERRATTSNH